MEYVQIRNVSGVMRRLRLLPPASQFFHLSQSSFPSADGLVAPGMATTAVLRFSPDTNADVHDEITVDTELSRFTVPLMAVREAPVLSLPQTVDCGHVYTGHAKTEEIQVEALRGGGAFMVFAADNWPQGTAEALRERISQRSRKSKLVSNSPSMPKVDLQDGTAPGAEGVSPENSQHLSADGCDERLGYQHQHAAVTSGSFSLSPDQFTLQQGCKMELSIRVASKQVGT